MLVLSRKVNGRIHIGEDITILIVRIIGDKVRIGIEAPKHMSIVREELLQRGTPCDPSTGSTTTHATASAASRPQSVQRHRTSRSRRERS